MGVQSLPSGVIQTGKASFWDKDALRLVDREFKKPPKVFEYIRPVVVSKAFRAYVLGCVPPLRHDAALCRLVGHLLFPGLRDRDTGQTLVPYRLLAAFEEKSETNYSGIAFLRRAQLSCLPGLRWEEHQYGGILQRGKVRRVIATGLPDEVHARAVDETSRPLVEPVDFVSGEKWTAAKQRASRAEAKKQAQQAQNVSDEPPQDVVRLMAYLNARPPHIFTKAATAYLGEAYDLARTLPEASRTYALQTLRQIELQPQPFYAQSREGRSARVFAQGQTILALPRALRAVMTQGWTWFDLRAAQLAVLSVQWDVSALRPYLGADAGRDFWEEMFHHLGPVAQELFRTRGSDYEVVKGAMKQTLYSVAFGAGRRRAYWDLPEMSEEAIVVMRAEVGRALKEDPSAVVRRFHEHPVMKAVWAARDRQGRALATAGQAVDCFGKTHVVDGSRRSVRSVLARLAQAQEMELMLPVLDVAEQYPNDVSIAAWLHDGVAVSFANHSKKERYAKSVVEAVKNRASELGIPTFLEMEKS